MKKYKDPAIQVNVCFQLKDERKCVTLPKEQAYVTREWIEKNDGTIYWFQPVG